MLTIVSAPDLYRLKNSNFWFLTSLLFLLACGEGPPKEPVTIEKQFRTTAPSRIYFQNIRSTAYQWDQDPKSRTDYYLLRSIASTSPRPILYPLIANIWMEDQAQILLKYNEQETLPSPIEIHWQKDGASGVYRLDSLTPTSQYELALSIYQAINQSRKLEITLPGKSRQPLFRNAAERKDFQVSVQDYLRLTEYF